MYSVLYTIITLIVFLCSAGDAYFYPGFCQSHFKINAEVILLIYISLSLILSAFNQKPYLKSFQKINNKFIFPFLLIGYITILFFEKYCYPNFVFATFHVHRLTFLNLLAASATVFYITFPKFRDPTKRIIYNLLPLILVFCHSLLLMSVDYLNFVIQEDGIFEYLQFFLYLISFFFSIKIFLIFKKKSKYSLQTLFFFLLSISLFFISGEEISWGQRIFGFATPEKYTAINYQQETTLHNLNGFQQNFLHLGYILIGIYGLLSDLILRKLFPKIYSNFHWITMPFYLIFCFFALSSYYLLYDYFQYLHILTPGKPANFILGEEIGETYLALAMFFYTTKIFKKLNS